MKLAFIGFGEVAYHLARDLRPRDVEITAFRRRPEVGQARADEVGVRLCSTLADALVGADIVMSCVWPHTAVEVAQQASALLRPGQLFADLNSISPGTARRVQAAVESSGATVAKISIMSAATAGLRTPMLVGGPAGHRLFQILEPLGFRLQLLDQDMASAAAFKIVRSYGLKAILAASLEMLRAARRYGVADEMLASCAEFMHWDGCADWVNMSITSTAIHAGRRAQEMDEAMETLRELGLKTELAAAVRGVFQDVEEAQLSEIFGERSPASYHVVLDALESRTDTC